MTECKAQPRLLIYSQDGLGLGHLRRTSLLAAEFLVAEPDGCVLTICDSPIGRFFSSAPGHDYMKLPSIVKLGPGDWSPITLALPLSDALAIRGEVIRAATLKFRPDVVLVDHMPHGAMGELLPTLQALEPIGTRVVLGLRDILDAPVTVQQRWQLEGAFEAVERHFSEVLVYGSREVFDVADEYAWPSRIRSRLSYCGYVCAPASRRPAQAVRRQYLAEEPDADLVVAMAGGGADAYGFFDTLLRAAPAVLANRRCVLVGVTGPYLPSADRLRLQELAAGRPIHLLPTVADSLSYLAAADLVVAMAGYNTTAEILSTGARALLVPRAGPSAEQQMRASRFAERDWVSWVPPQTLSADTLAAAIVEALQTPPRRPAAGPDLGGRSRAAAHLLGGLRGPLVAADGQNGALAADRELVGAAPASAAG